MVEMEEMIKQSFLARSSTEKTGEEEVIGDEEKKIIPRCCVFMSSDIFSLYDYDIYIARECSPSLRSVI